MDKNYGKLIWTNHAISRMRERGIKQSEAWATWRRPDNSRYAKSKSAWIYYRTFSNNQLEVVAKKNEKGQWVILSVWSKPVVQKKSNAEKMSPFKNILKRILKF